jgi:hypothetical protein
MNRLLGGSFSLIFSIVVSFGIALAQQAIGPRIVLEERYFDAKQIKEGGIIQHTFKVLNTGDHTLEIQKVNPG